MNTLQEKLDAFKRILSILDNLRVNCPWDKKQTNESLRTLTIEETYELADAIMKNNPDKIQEELGDLFLHIIFYAKIASEKHQFDIADVLNKLSEKMINRHPHVYGEIKTDDIEEIKNNWEEIKLKEKNGNKTVMGGISDSMPSLIKAIRIQDKAGNVGFDWENKADVWNKVKEELVEFERAIAEKDKKEKEAEFGDIMFALVNVARLYDINPDNALERTNLKFIKRFNYIEQKLKQANKTFKETNLEQMDDLWEEAKNY